MPTAEPGSDLDLSRARDVAIAAARSAGQFMRSRIHSIGEVRHKGLVDLVTDVDVQSEHLISEAILSAFPTHAILGEEGGARAGSDARYRWIIDPLDGTTNYAHGLPLFCVSIGLEVEGQLRLGAVFGPMQDELFVAEAGKGATLNGQPIHVSETSELRQAMLATGFPYDRADLPRALRSFETFSWKVQAVRRLGSAALDLCYVGCGRIDGYWEHVVRPWDLAAGALIVLEAGGALSGTDGSPFSVDAGQVLATNSRLHPAMAETLASL